jgi:glucosamine 6-phosphate synthetase-like amidotransferase/phosphosugar isomerase protein
MCGIVGIVGEREVGVLLVDALKRLEYRGYDSAGIATISNGQLGRRRAEGKLVNLETRLAGEPLAGTVGIGHTRWATHGAPTERNAHPHFCSGVAVVHNGIIENFAPLRAELTAKGAEFHSQTDTEVVAQLLAAYRAEGLAPREAMQKALSRLEGAYALAVLFEDQPDMILGARSGPPLAVGHGEGEMFLGSDAMRHRLLCRAGGKYWFETLARLPVEIDVASEFRYREAPLPEGGLALFISQSGETADTLAALRYAKTQMQHIVSVVNAPESSIARESDAVLHTLAGPEIGVASTKAFTTQLAVLACLAIATARARGTIDQAREATLAVALREVPSRAVEVLTHDERIRELAHFVGEARDVLYLGRGTSFPLAWKGR